MAILLNKTDQIKVRQVILWSAGKFSAIYGPRLEKVWETLVYSFTLRFVSFADIVQKSF